MRIRSNILMFMKRKHFRAVLTDLARTDEETYFLSNGRVNASAMARTLGVTQATISRALQNPKYQPKPPLIDAICREFGVSAAQARGEETLKPTDDASRRLSPRAVSIAERFEALSSSKKKLLESLLTELDPPSEQRRTG